MQIWLEQKPEKLANQHVWKAFWWSCQPSLDAFPGKITLQSVPKVCHVHRFLALICHSSDVAHPGACCLSHSYGWRWCLVLFPLGNQMIDLSVHLPDGLHHCLVWPLKLCNVLPCTAFMDGRSCFSFADKGQWWLTSSHVKCWGEI